MELDLTRAKRSGETIEDDILVTHEKVVFEMVMKVEYKTGIISVEARQDSKKIIGKQSITFDG